MRAFITVAVVGLLVSAASVAQAQVNISAGAEVFPLSGGPPGIPEADGNGGILTPPSSQAFPASVGSPTGSFANAYVEANVTNSTVTASGSADSATGSGLDQRFATAVSNLSYDFSITDFTQLVYSYQLQDGTGGVSSGDYTQRIAYFSLEEFQPGDPTPIPYINTSTHSGSPASASGVLPLFGGNFALFAGAESQTLFQAGQVPVPVSSPGELTWELSLQFLDGQNQATAFLPTTITPNGGWLFENMPGGFWYDPVLADGFLFEMLTTESYFTEAEMPLGIGAEFTLVYMDGLNPITVPLLEGESYNFPAGVTSFTILDIPPFDPDDPLAFPIYLDFSTSHASFTMTPLLVPEPGSLVLLAMGGLFAVACRRHRKSRHPAAR